MAATERCQACTRRVREISVTPYSKSGRTRCESGAGREPALMPEIGASVKRIMCVMLVLSACVETREASVGQETRCQTCDPEDPGDSGTYPISPTSALAAPAMNALESHRDNRHDEVQCTKSVGDNGQITWIECCTGDVAEGPISFTPYFCCGTNGVQVSCGFGYQYTWPA